MFPPQDPLRRERLRVRKARVILCTKEDFTSCGSPGDSCAPWNTRAQGIQAGGCTHLIPLYQLHVCRVTAWQRKSLLSSHIPTESKAVLAGPKSDLLHHFHFCPIRPPGHESGQTPPRQQARRRLPGPGWSCHQGCCLLKPLRRAGQVPASEPPAQSHDSHRLSRFSLNKATWVHRSWFDKQASPALGVESLSPFWGSCLWKESPLPRVLLPTKGMSWGVGILPRPVLLLGWVLC